jgi:hypothetical protein
LLVIDLVSLRGKFRPRSTEFGPAVVEIAQAAGLHAFGLAHEPAAYVATCWWLAAAALRIEPSFEVVDTYTGEPQPVASVLDLANRARTRGIFRGPPNRVPPGSILLSRGGLRWDWAGIVLGHVGDQVASLEAGAVLHRDLTACDYVDAAAQPLPSHNLSR